MCNRALLLFGKMPQRNFYVNCHENGKTFQSGLRFQTGLSSLRDSCKRALKHLLLFEICACEICEKFVYNHSENTEHVKN